MANKDDAKPRKIIDVTEPGKTAPPATAKPIIVSNRPMLKQDPMMAPDGTDSPKPEPAEPSVSRVGKPIAVMIDQAKKEQAPGAAKPDTPPSAPDVPKPVVEPPVVRPSVPAEAPSGPASAGPELSKPEEQAAPGETPAENHPVSSPAEPKPLTVSEPAPPTAQTPPAAETPASEADTTDDTQTTLSGDEQVAPNQLNEDAKRKADEDQAAKVAEQEKIIASKKYYLPIEATKNRRGMRRALLLLVLVVLVALVWFDVVLDAGIVRVPGVHAVTHFFQG